MRILYRAVEPFFAMWAAICHLRERALARRLHSDTKRRMDAATRRDWAYYWHTKIYLRGEPRKIKEPK